jgi:HD-GYP domain-containing protein (c-di-GMP phosphodiesterase class II)
MKSIKVSELRPGMKFDKPVYVDGVNLLVPELVPLKQKEIDRLKKWNIQEVTTEGEMMEASPSDSKAAFFQEAFRTPGQQQVMRVYTELSKNLSEIFNQIKKLAKPDPDDINDIIDRMFKTMETHRGDMIQFILYGVQGESGFVENALNCAVLSIMVGTNLNYVQHQLVNLATAALLHDIGMLRLPEALVNKTGKLGKDELQTIRTHPVHSYKIITRELSYSEEIGIAALQHQERWDGGGYPRGLSGNDISLNARIIAIVDSFEAMVSKRPYRNSMIGYQAIRAILSDNGRRFDPDILKTFIRSMGIYPIGSIVLLSNSCIGRVVDTNSSSPMRPKVKIMIDEHGREYSKDNGEVVDLLEDKSLFVAKAINPQDIAGQAPA